jgi:replicative DNA helicase
LTVDVKTANAYVRDIVEVELLEGGIGYNPEKPSDKVIAKAVVSKGKAVINVPEMKARALRMKDIDCIVIDYLQLMSGTKRTDNRVNEVSEITRSLKMMAKDLNIPVVTCSQLSRGVAKNTGDHRPQMTDLRESGTIEQDADIVLMLHREDYYKNNPDEEADTESANIAEVIVGKNRHGSTETVKVAWNPEFTMFSTLERIKDDR